jgi:hypothetical protein
MKKRNFWLTEKQIAGLEALAKDGSKVAPSTFGGRLTLTLLRIRLLRRVRIDDVQHRSSVGITATSKIVLVMSVKIIELVYTRHKQLALAAISLPNNTERIVYR